jgi:hypothetical protein
MWHEHIRRSQALIHILLLLNVEFRTTCFLNFPSSTYLDMIYWITNRCIRWNNNLVHRLIYGSISPFLKFEKRKFIPFLIFSRCSCKLYHQTILVHGSDLTNMYCRLKIIAVCIFNNVLVDPDSISSKYLLPNIDLRFSDIFRLYSGKCLVNITCFLSGKICFRVLDFLFISAHNTLSYLLIDMLEKHKSYYHIH